jgi:hypothetical protein
MVSRSCLLFTFLALLPLAAEESKPFQITVVDEQTGRGVPLVELRTVNNLRQVTDSNGIVAFREPGFMGRKVFFHLRSHGYEFRKDGFGFRGQALEVTPGGHARLKIKRINLAERLYRITGAGIYADSVLVGHKPPLAQPLLNAQVLGSDSVINALYHGKVYWFWGDTNRLSYPLGNFHVPGATSLLPGQGGLHPEVGIDLTYFVDDRGFAKPTCQMPGKGPTWITGLVALGDNKGRERLFASYVKVEPPLKVYEHGLAEFNDSRQAFEKVLTFPKDAPFYPAGHPFLHQEGGKKYLYFASPYPLLRVPADPEHLKDLSHYEAYTCLAPGTRTGQRKLDRAPEGSLRYGWKKNTSPVGLQEQARLIKAGLLQPHEALLQLRDVDSGKPVLAHSGSVYWNAYRQRWVMITVQIGGTSLLGEVWYAEGDTPLGPWVYARKVVTHDRYSFYNPKQHPLFDKDGGKTIFFEGTYTHTFSGNPDQTPRYDYNQIMYKLDLSQPSLHLPVPIYQLSSGKVADRFGRKDQLGPNPDQPIAFFALDRPGKGTVPVHSNRRGPGGDRLVVGKGEKAESEPLFYALPADVEKPPANTVPLYTLVSRDGKNKGYSIDEKAPPGYERSRKPICLVWDNPARK